MAKTNKAKEVKTLSKDELVTKIRELEAELFQTKLKKVTGQLANKASLWSMRKQLARMKTFYTQATAPAAKK